MINSRRDEMTALGRGGLAVYLLTQAPEMTTGELAEKLGYHSSEGVRFCIDRLSLAGVPIYSPAPGRWTLNRRDFRPYLPGPGRETE